MTRKEVYKLALRASQETLRAYFGAPMSFADEYFQKQARGKAIVKKVYDNLAAIIVPTDV